MALYDGEEVSDELLREFLAVALMMGGKFSAFAGTPKDLVDEFLAERVHFSPNVFESAQNKGLLDFVGVGGETDYYEVTQEGMEFVRGEK